MRRTITEHGSNSNNATIESNAPNQSFFRCMSPRRNAISSAASSAARPIVGCVITDEGTAMDDVSPLTDALMDSDRRHLIHPLHHPKDHADARLFTRGEGAILHTSDGREYI